MENEFYLQTWESDDGEEETQHFLNDKFGTYVFGFNKKLLGQKTYAKVKAIIKSALKHKKI